MSTGPFKHNNSTALYKEMLALTEIPNQRAKIESRFNSDLETWYKAYKNSL
jgi:general stress protein 26